MGDVGGGITSDVDIHRYSRHMLLPSFQRSGQEALSQAQVVVVGVGGLGSSCLLYLAAAGFGRIRVVDFDVVELSNLHRQVIHSEEAAAINLSKVDSALKQLRSLNSNVVYEGMNEKLCHDNVLQVLEGADVVVDATDNFRARYLLCDACFLQQIPLVSGSAVGFEGQITVYNPKNTTCYRCLYPVPSMAENCRSCSNAGVFGPVPGVIGCLQASEAIKMVVYLKGPNSSDDRASLKVNPLLGRQLYYDSLTGNCSNFDLPPSDPECCLCGEKSSILTIEDSKENMDQMFEQLSGSHVAVELPESNNITASDFYDKVYSTNSRYILLDVRNSVQFKMVNLRFTVANYRDNGALFPQYKNMPLSMLQKLTRSGISSELSLHGEEVDVYTICRRGVDSVSAAKFLLDNGKTNVKNIEGGLNSWHQTVDSSFPFY